MPKKGKKIEEQKKKENIKKQSDTYKSNTKQKLVSNAMEKSLDVKSTKNYVAYNPQTNTIISGSISEIATKS